METYKFIADETELRWFWDYGIPPLKREEIYFVSLSARNKKLSEEEREFFKVSRSEMFAKQQIRHDNFDSFLQHIKRFEVRKDAYLTKSGQTYPEKCLVCYWNTTPINAYTSMKDQMNYLTETLQSLADSAIKNSSGGIDESFYKIRKSFDTCQSLFARNFGTKYWLDFDIDKDDGISEFEYKNVQQVFKDNGFIKNDVMYVKTVGGLHCLLKKEKLHMNPEYICSEIKKVLGSDVHEVVRNTNEMIPLVGTFQYGIPVTVLNKEDFDEGDKFVHGEVVK